MNMAVLTVNDMVAAGLDITTAAQVAATSGGDLLPNAGGDAFLVVYNGGASNMTVTVPAQRTSVSREGFPTVTVPDISVTVPASKYKIVGPFGRAAYNDGNGIPLVVCGMPRYDAPWSQIDAGDGRTVRRYSMASPFDMTMSDHNAQRTLPGKFVDEDHKLCGCFENIIADGRQSLIAMGLENPLAGADNESQDSGMRRNPMMVRCEVNTRSS
jgi:hypothetical protein